MAVRARRKRTSTLAANLETDARFMRGEPFKRVRAYAFCKRGFIR